MQGKLIYITGLSGSGKTTLAKELQKQNPSFILLDGDELRQSINSDLGYDEDSKILNIRRNNQLIELLYKQGFTIIAAFMASISRERDKVFETCKNNFKIQLTTPLEVCKYRDPKGLYKKNLQNFSGINFKYEGFLNPDLELDTSKFNIEECYEIISTKLQDR
jgi:adenylylsulfate kinase-like enzyme